jgi:hypothetical protein
MVQKQSQNFQFITRTQKQVAFSKRVCHPEAERLVMDEVKERWERGNPATRPEMYNLLCTTYDPSTSFHKLYLTEKKLSSLSQWLSRVLARSMELDHSKINGITKGA